MKDNRIENNSNKVTEIKVIIIINRKMKVINKMW